MKLFTRPRPMHPYQLRAGDQIAVLRTSGEPIISEVAYMDNDLADLVGWSVVHHVAEQPSDEAMRYPVWDVIHTYGTHPVQGRRTLTTREALELDPWSYVRTAMDAA